MPQKYNIIFTSPDKDEYLWNGASFDKIADSDREVLLFSGKSVKEEDLEQALNLAGLKAKELFADDEPKIKTVKITVS